MVKNITLYGITFLVDYDIDPGEPMVMYDSNMEGRPGTEDEIIINGIYYNDVDFLLLFENNLEMFLNEL